MTHPRPVGVEYMAGDALSVPEFPDHLFINYGEEEWWWVGDPYDCITGPFYTLDLAKQHLRNILENQTHGRLNFKRKAAQPGG